MQYFKTHDCIIKNMDENYAVLYSFTNGNFYLIEKNSISFLYEDKINLKKRININDSNFKYIISKSINPSDINYSNFTSPLVVGVMISNCCNLACNYCLANNGNSYSKENLLIKNESNLIKKLTNSEIISLLISGGEPTLYNNLPNFLYKIYNSNFLIMLDTNGVSISDNLIDILKKTNVYPRISLDSIDKEIHDKNRGDFINTFQNIQKLLNNKINVRINTVIHQNNILELEKLAEFMINSGIKTWHLFKLQKEFAPQSLWLEDSLVEETVSHLKYKYGEQLNILCKFTKSNDSFASFVIDSQGNCFSTNNKSNTEKKVIFGNVLEKNLQYIWQKTPLDYRLRHYKKHLTFEGK